VVLEGPNNTLIEQAIKFEFKASNNQVEYEVIIIGLNLAIDLEMKNLKCKSDFRLVVGQLNEEFEVREALLQRYIHFIRNLITKFDEVSIQHDGRENNTRADALSRLATARKKGTHRSVIYVTLTNPSVGVEECMTTDTQLNWMTPIKQYLTDGISEAHSEKTMKQQTARFLLID